MKHKEQSKGGQASKMVEQGPSKMVTDTRGCLMCHLKPTLE